MIDKLFALAYIDRKARTRIYTKTFAVSVALGVASLAAGGSTVNSAIFTAVLTFVILTVWIGKYLLQAETVVAFKSDYPLNIPVTHRLAVSGFFLSSAVALGFSANNIEAAVIDQRLKKYSSFRTFSDTDLDTLLSVLEYAHKNRVKIDGRAISQIGSRLLSYSNEVSSSESKALSRQVVQVAATAQSNLKVHQDRSHDQLRRSTTSLPPFAAFSHCIFRNLTLELNGHAFIDSIMVDCEILYNGGPVILQNTGFERCTFKFNDSPAGNKLLSLLVQRNDPDFYNEEGKG